METESPSAGVFVALLSGDVGQLTRVSGSELRPFLPLLSRMVLSPSQHSGLKKILHTLIAGMSEVNPISQYLSLNFKELKQDARREQQLLKKLAPDEGRGAQESILASSLQYGLAIEFERSDCQRRFRLCLSELLRILARPTGHAQFKIVQSDLFECEVHFEEVGDIVCLAAAELPELLGVVELSEALLYLQRGPELLTKMVANMPHVYNQVVTHLVVNGETLDEVSLSGRCRVAALMSLCLMHPTQAPYIQALALEHCKHPTLALWLALQAEKTGERTGVVTLLHNIVIAGGENKRAWFTQYLKCMQQKYRRHRLSAVSLLRSFLMKKLSSFLKKPIPESEEVISRQTSEDPMEEDSSAAKEPADEGPVSDTLEDLVDLMEIEISDQEDEGQRSGLKGQESGDKEQRKSLRRSSTVEVEFRAISLDCQLSDGDVTELRELLQVCCGLKTQTMMYLKEDEAGAILSLIVSTCPPFSPAGVQFIQTSLCVLLACPFLIRMEECESAVVSWFQWLLQFLPEFDHCRCSYGELLLLVAIHLREGQLDQIKQLISSSLHVKLTGSLRSGHFMTLKRLFLSVFTENVVCAHAVSVPPTPGIHGNMSGHLPIHCVQQLVKTRTFRRHGIHIKDWVYGQLLTASEPLHPVLASLLQEFVSCVLLSPLSSRPGSGPAFTRLPEIHHQPFTPQQVLSVFSGDGHSMAAQVAMFYYFILYQDCYHSNMTALLAHSKSSASPTAYSPSVVAMIPIKHLLNHVQSHQSLYSDIYPSLLKLTAIHFSHLGLLSDVLDETNRATTVMNVAKIAKRKVSAESAKRVLEQLQCRPSQALLVLTQLTSLPPSQLEKFSSVILSSLTLLLEQGVSRRIQELYVTLWTKLHAHAPRRMLLDTVNALRAADKAHLRPYTHQDIAEDPLILLQCDRRVFRCPAVFHILLRMIVVAATYSSSWLREHAYKQQCVTAAEGKVPPGELQALSAGREDQCNTLIATQDSAVVQLLLETCLPTEQDQSGGEFGPLMQVLREIRCLLCSYLHHTFIDKPGLVKLVHFQGYPSELLPMMVAGIPSMHICVDFIPELLAQSDTSKQQFGIQLAAQVMNQYPLPEVLPIAEDIFKRLSLSINELPASERGSYFTPLLPSIVLLCQTFPPLCSQAGVLLVELSRESWEQWLTDSPSLVENVRATFQKLVDRALLKT